MKDPGRAWGAAWGSHMRLVRFLYFYPGEKLADALGTSDEHERGLLRQLVNSLIWILLAAAIFMVAVVRH